CGSTRDTASPSRSATTMFRKTSGAILCPSCGRLTTAEAPVCLVCGRRNPGMWGFGGPLGALFGRSNFTNPVLRPCAALHVIPLGLHLPGLAFASAASGSIFGLLGAIVAYGRKRGGVYGRMVLQQYGQWALILFIMGFFMPGVNNWAHAGGFAGGFIAGLGLS